MFMLQNDLRYCSKLVNLDTGKAKMILKEKDPQRPGEGDLLIHRETCTEQDI